MKFESPSPNRVKVRKEGAWPLLFRLVWSRLVWSGTTTMVGEGWSTRISEVADRALERLLALEVWVWNSGNASCVIEHVLSNYKCRCKDRAYVVGRDGKRRVFQST